ncbi:MAG: UDP-N-acetylmuramoyl-L-alanine--D-glutamate ligase [Candidatus Puniceispirillales bacterium]
MIIPVSMQFQTVGILGLGRSGLASAAALVAAGAVVHAHDDHASPALPDGAMATAWQDWPWAQMDALVISPGIPHRFPEPHPAAARAEAEGVAIISDIEVLMRARPQARIIGITGTNGKSTTALLLDHMLKAAGIASVVGGNIGHAVLALDDPGPEGVMVLELSSYQLETTPGLRLDAGAVINITPDHLDRHDGWQGYCAAKANLAKAVIPEGLLVLGRGDELDTMATAATAQAERIGPGDAPIIINCPALAGPHNIENTAIAFKLAGFLGADRAPMEAALDTFTGLPHRMEEVARSGPIHFVNDSKATNAAAARQALRSFPAIYWIAGGEAKAEGLAPLIDDLGNVTCAYLIGASAESFAAALAGHIPAKRCGTLDEAVTTAFDDARRADAAEATILLSPAAASFDQFRNFEERGLAFRDLATTLATEAADVHAQ